MMTRRIAFVLATLLLAAPAAGQSPQQLRHILTQVDSARREAVGSRGFVRAAETRYQALFTRLDSLILQLQRMLAAADTLPPPVVPAPDTTPPPRDTVAVPPTGTVPVLPRSSVVPAGAELIIGPQMPLGQSPWPWHDTLLKVSGEIWGAKFLAGGGDFYYDLGQVLYTLAERSQDTAHLRLAREVTGAWWAKMQALATGNGGRDDVAPRSAALGSLIIYALDGHGDDVWPVTGDSIKDRLAGVRLWDWLAMYTRGKWATWIGRYTGPTTTALRYGVRDGGYALLFTAQLALTHPDSAVRAEMKDLALRGARDYYARLQFPDGGWYWSDAAADVRIMRSDSTFYLHSQPFMVGLLLDGMIEAHRATGDSAIARSILRATEWLAEVYRTDLVMAYDTAAKLPTDTPWLYQGQQVGWRGHWYFVFEPGTVLPHEPLTASDPVIDRGRVVQGSTKLGGTTAWDTNAIRSVRQMVPEVVHAFGYAYQLTRDPKYREWGDEQFAAAFGKGLGPSADPFYCLADDIKGKSINQAFRTSSRYLRSRLGN
jgi:hypothetical protein